MRLAGEVGDRPTLLMLLALGVIGVIAVSSATHDPGGGLISREGWRQLVYLVIGLGVYLVAERIDYHDWADSAWFLYGAGLIVLAALPLVARPINGARAWIDLGVFRIQPSEPMKAVVVLAAATFLAATAGKLSFRRLVTLGALIGIPVLLIALQPDLGTVLTFVPLFVALAWLAGIRPRVLVVLALIGALLLPVMWFGVLKDYQKERIITVFDPERDPTGTGYQVIQSRIAVGSGGFAGKGLFRGSQSRLDFLPARQTDFVLAVIAEETGFVGVLVVFGLYAGLLFRAFRTATVARDRLGTFIAVGVASLWAGQIFVNAGMVAGILPTIGVPLPLLSYGGSSVIATFLAFGLVASVRSGRYVNA
ncbi:MAG: peptidoglycan glycosyltransferase MrdB [Acidobacteriota bacterium]|nr:MAG: rod shape-determining protein RodA [Acidobacteriota bacterium]